MTRSLAPSRETSRVAWEGKRRDGKVRRQCNNLKTPDSNSPNHVKPSLIAHAHTTACALNASFPSPPVPPSPRLTRNPLFLFAKPRKAIKSTTANSQPHCAVPHCTKYSTSHQRFSNIPHRFNAANVTCPFTSTATLHSLFKKKCVLLLQPRMSHFQHSSMTP